MNTKDHAQVLKTDWTTNPRWKGIVRPYSAEEVIKLAGSLQIEHTLARRGSTEEEQFETGVSSAERASMFAHDDHFRMEYGTATD